MASTDWINGTVKQLAHGSVKKTAGVLDAASGVQTLITAWKDYQHTQQVESTRREQIWADRDVKLAAIKEQATIMRQIVDRTFEERASNFKYYFDLLEQGFANGNDQQISAALTMIVEQTKVSPMAQAVALIHSMNDPDVKVIEL